MSGAWAQAFSLVFDPYNIVVMLAASLFDLFVGAVGVLLALLFVIQTLAMTRRLAREGE